MFSLLNYSIINIYLFSWVRETPLHFFVFEFTSVSHPYRPRKKERNWRNYAVNVPNYKRWCGRQISLVTAQGPNMSVWVTHLWGRGQTSTCYLLHASVIDYNLLFWHFETTHLSPFLYCICLFVLLLGFYFIRLMSARNYECPWFVFVLKVILKYQGHLNVFLKPSCVHSLRSQNIYLRSRGLAVKKMYQR